MGGGDLNTKKSWHPNTMKNQERVWKAEQAAAEEKKRIQELQREREEENDRAQLKEMALRNFGASGSADNRLHWMYDNKPDKQTQQEDYLLGKAIGKNENETQQNAISAVSRRVVGSSMLTTGDDSQVDLARKLREDPLLLVKERERAARAALLNNPLQRKKLTELLRKEQEQKELKSKKKSKKKDTNLDDVLAAKLNALGGNKGIDLTSLLNSDDDSSESSSSDEKSKKKKKKRKHEKKKSKKSKKKKKQSSDSESDTDDEVNTKRSKKTKKEKKEKDLKKLNKNNTFNLESETDSSDDDTTSKKKKSTKNKKNTQSKHSADKTSRKRKSEDDSESDTEMKSKRRRYYDTNKHWNESDSRKDRNYPVTAHSRKESYATEHRENESRLYNGRLESSRGERRDETDKRYERDRRKVSSVQSKYEEDRRNKRPGLSEEEKAAKLAEMFKAGAAREADRSERVARQRAEDAAEKAQPRAARNEAHALPDSLESRIRSNRHYIQRDRLHMNEHFARR